jgi:hypothetical protein
MATAARAPGGAGPAAGDGLDFSAKTAEERKVAHLVRESPARFSMTMEELAREFAKGPEATEKKYEGKVVEVRGVVFAFVDSGDLGSALFLKAPPDTGLGNLECKTANPQPWAKVAPGQEIKVKCMVRSHLRQHGCLVTPEGPNPAVPVAPEQLAKDFEADPKAAAKKYAAKWLVLEGEVAGKEEAGKEEAMEVGTQSIGFVGPKVTFRTPGKVRLLCYFGVAGGGLRGRPEVGQRLKLIGRCRPSEEADVVRLLDCQPSKPEG